MNADRKTLAAAVAGVLAYIKTEEEALCAQQMGIPAAGRTSPPTRPVKLWGVSGRQEQMHLRGLMQLRTFKGTHFR